MMSPQQTHTHSPTIRTSRYKHKNTSVNLRPQKILPQLELILALFHMTHQAVMKILIIKLRKYFRKMLLLSMQKAESECKTFNITTNSTSCRSNFQEQWSESEKSRASVSKKECPTTACDSVSIFKLYSVTLKCPGPIAVNKPNLLHYMLENTFAIFVLKGYFSIFALVLTA